MDPRRGRDCPSPGPHRLFLVVGCLLCGIVLGGHVAEGADRSSDRLIVGIFPERFQLAKNIQASMTNGASIKLRKLPTLTNETIYDQILEARHQLDRKQVKCIVGEHDPSYATAAEKLGLPYLETSVRENGALGTFHVLPTPSEITGLILDILSTSPWQRVGVIYQETLDPTFVNMLLQKTEPDLKFFKLRMTFGDQEIRKMLLKLREREHAFVVLTSMLFAKNILLKARQLGMISAHNSWVVLNLGSDDIYEGLLEDLQTNITTITLLTPEDARQAAPVHDKLVYTAFADALAAVAGTTANVAESTAALSEKLMEVSVDGTTGPVSFDKDGLRENLTLFMYSSKDQFQRPLNRQTPYKLLQGIKAIANATQLLTLKGRRLKVVTILEKPFAMLVDNAGAVTGNARFEGFTVDLLNEISQKLDFTYELYEVHDGKFGVLKENGEWNGIIGEILAGNATMSVAPLSINTAREEALDFTNTFMTRAITVLMKTPESQSSYFQFMKPLSDEVWVCTLITMVIITVMLFVYEKYSVACRKDMPKLNLRESLWFIFGSLVQGSTESAPVTIPGRILTSAWWFFSLILISTYTANLAAFLTVKKINTPISSVTDLADQINIPFGTVSNSGVEMFFRHTNIEPFKKMWNQMSSSEFFTSPMVNSTSEGLARAKNGSYAFLWDNTVTSYLAATDCSVTEIGPSFDPKGFGIAVMPGVSYREELSRAILELVDDGRMDELKDRYWPKNSKCTENSKTAPDETSELELENVAGMFFVLIGGIALGALAFGLERLVRKTTSYYKTRANRNNKGLDDTKI